MDETSRQISAKVCFENDKENKFKFALFFKNMQIVYEFETSSYCVIPFSFINGLSLDGRVLRINFESLPFYFRMDSKVPNYCALNSCMNVKNNDMTNQDHHLLIFYSNQKAFKFYSSLIDFKSTTNFTIKTSTTASTKPKFIRFEEYFFSQECLLRNNASKPLKRRKEDEDSDKGYKKQKNVLFLTDCYLDNKVYLYLINNILRIEN